jgi:hypothetical protein
MNYLNLTRNFISESLLILLGIFIISIIFSFSESDRGIKVAGVASDSVEISVTVSEAISISSPGDISLSPEIIGSGSATGDVTWNLITNNDSGWKLELEADSSPAMQKGADYFADYTEATAGVPENWSVGNNDSEFGFSVDGSYAKSEYFSGTRFEGFSGSTKIEVADDSLSTPSGGAEVDVNFRAEVGVDATQPSGLYTATITATATTL